MPVAESSSFGRERVPIDGRARGVVRRFKAGLPVALPEKVRESASFTRAVSAALAKNTERGRWRAATRASRAHPQLRLESVQQRLVVWSYLEADDHLLVNPREPGEAQDAVIVKYLLAILQADKMVMLHSGLWTLEVPDHALGRLAMRAPGVDLRSAIYQAHSWALRARMPVPIPRRDRTVLLPAGDGAFLARFIIGRDEASGEALAYLRLRTWVPHNRLRTDQHLLETGAPSLGSSLLLPQPLRTIEVDGYRATVTRRRPGGI